MKLKSLSCTQFAGIRDRQVQFSDGINVICGANESGKTTLVNLLSRTLFQNARLDNRSDKGFLEQYFPAPVRNGKAGDFADGRVTFETAGETYTLSKEWGPDPRCTLSTPDGILRDPTAVDSLLRQALGYGEGVYGQLLFSTRRGADQALRELVDAAAKSDTRQELTQALSKALAQTDGISPDRLEAAIEEKIEAIAGKHWDFDRDAPMRKNGRWATGLGEILKTWYALEDARAVERELSQLEQELVTATAADAAAQTAAAQAEQTLDAFRQYAARLTVREEREKNLRRLEGELSRLEEVLTRWPRQAEELEQARELRNENRRRIRQVLLADCRALTEERTRLQNLLTTPCPTEEEVTLARQTQKQIQKLENSLGAMNLRAALTLFGKHSVEIRSLRTGEPVEISDETAHLTEAVILSVPGVMELTLTPADVDAAAVQAQLTAARQTLNELLSAYGAETPEAMEAMTREAQTLRRQAEELTDRLTRTLGTMTLEELEAAVAADPGPVRSAHEMEAAVMALCGSMDADRFITARETLLEDYAARYGTPEAVAEQAEHLRRERQQTVDASAEEEIPPAYAAVTDPQTHLARLEQAQAEARRRREEAMNRRTAAAERLEAKREALTDDPAVLLEEAERAFSRQKELLGHWLQIRQVFRQQKDALSHNPVEGLADSFAAYLSDLSQGGVSPEFPRTDRLDVKLYSRDRLVDFAKLSEGTKAVVSLAFRLSVLDHLFPEGGVMVLDDPFADMDPRRTEQACALLRRCAQRHQIIFLTCREDCLSLLNGNVIRV